MSVFSLTASLATGTQDLSISKNVQESVQIKFPLHSKICSKSFRKPFKLLRTKKCPRSQTVRLTWNADSAVILINPCPEICILKAGKFPLLNSSRKELPMATLCAWPLCSFWGYGGYAQAMEGPSGVHRLRLRGGTMWSSPTRRLRNPLHKQPTRKVCSQKKIRYRR